MTVFHPASWEEFQEVDKRLAPGAFANELPADWGDASTHRRRLPLDIFISELSERNRTPRLRERNDLARFHLGSCPYAMARSGLARAVFVAGALADLDDISDFTTDKIAALRSTTRTLRRRLNEADITISSIGHAQEHYEEIDFSPFRELSDAIAAIERAKGPIDKLFFERSQTSRNVWRIRFVSSLFGTWWRLTGSDPSPAGLFMDFLCAGYASLSDVTQPDLGWESAIKTARKDGAGRWRDDPGTFTANCPTSS